jgi:hypothetical protein
MKTSLRSASIVTVAGIALLPMRPAVGGFWCHRGGWTSSSSFAAAPSAAFAAVPVTSQAVTFGAPMVTTQAVAPVTSQAVTYSVPTVMMQAVVPSSAVGNSQAACSQAAGAQAAGAQAISQGAISDVISAIGTLRQLLGGLSNLGGAGGGGGGGIGTPNRIDVYIHLDDSGDLGGGGGGILENPALRRGRSGARGQAEASAQSGSDTASLAEISADIRAMRGEIQELSRRVDALEKRK